MVSSDSIRRGTRHGRLLNVLTVFAHPGSRSFCHAALDRFSAGLRDAGHANEILDLYAIGFDPIAIDVLASCCKMDMAQLNAELLSLELAGQIEMLPGGFVRRLATS